MRLSEKALEYVLGIGMFIAMGVVYIGSVAVKVAVGVLALVVLVTGISYAPDMLGQLFGDPASGPDFTRGRCYELCRPEAVKTILEDECVCSVRRVPLKGKP